MGHTENTQTLTKTDEQIKKVLSKFTILCWAAFMAILGHMRSTGRRLDTPGPTGSCLLCPPYRCTPEMMVCMERILAKPAHRPLSGGPPGEASLLSDPAHAKALVRGRLHDSSQTLHAPPLLKGVLYLPSWNSTPSPGSCFLS